MKTCNRCGEAKPLSEFSVYKTPPVVRPRCKQCVALGQKERRARHKTRNNAYVYPKALPRRNKGSRVGRIQVALLEEIEKLREQGAMPTTNRFLYYRLIAARVITKGDTGALADVSDVTTALREAQVVEMDEIVDRSRGVSDFTGYSSIAGAAKLTARQAQLDRWPERPWPMLIVESNSLAGVLEEMAIEYRILLAPLGGNSSCGLLGGEIAPMLSDEQEVLYLGDWDYSGGLIERSARERLEAYAGVELVWQRVALTEEQVHEHELTVIQKFDGRTGKKHPAVETEALDQRILLPLVREALEALTPEDVADEEERQRADVIAKLDA